MSKATHGLEFKVEVCLGRGDGGSVIVPMKVTVLQYRRLIQCCKEDADMVHLMQLLKSTPNIAGPLLQMSKILGGQNP